MWCNAMHQPDVRFSRGRLFALLSLHFISIFRALASLPSCHPTKTALIDLQDCKKLKLVNDAHLTRCQLVPREASLAFEMSWRRRESGEERQIDTVLYAAPFHKQGWSCNCGGDIDEARRHRKLNIMTIPIVTDSPALALSQRE